MQDLFSGFCEVVVKVGDDHPGKKEKKTDDHSEKDLAKFGYILDVKVGNKNKNKNPSLFLAIYGTYVWFIACE